MTDFEKRLNRIAEQRGGTLAAPPTDIGNSYGDAPKAPQGRGLNVFAILLAFPIALALGAGSVLLGGILQIAVIDGGLTPASQIPPQLGIAAFAIAILVSIIADKVIGQGHVGPIAVTIGFVGMMWGEWRLAEMYPELWFTLYEAAYLAPAMEMLGLAEPVLVADIGTAAPAAEAPVPFVSGIAEEK